jgi:hypothetical protein
MAIKTSFICDCCQREAASNFGWARIRVDGDEKLMVKDQSQDICEIFAGARQRH